jgi:phosphoribosylformimino-5-aminoimidazole carboxamide ribotide isomerase
MNIYPAIDLKSGQCVRLYQGCFDQVTAYHNDPIEVAKTFAAQGAEFLHVVDLDGAKQAQPVHRDVIRKLANETGLNIQVGGGIRTRAQISEYLNAGISRVILGSIAIFQPETVKEWLEEFSEKIVVALDIRMDKTQEPKLTTQGWQENSETSLWDLLDTYQGTNNLPIICTDIARDGTLAGPNFVLYQKCVERYPTFKFQASGGIHSLNDVRKLSQIKVAGTIIGKALYENKFKLAEALQEAKSC